ncbi:MAG: hypothetical protein LJE96_14330 [Deltaproteobacteria bacterium]|nr:hypothetical protein [Deltaproteobacteria bacterium]
MKTVQKSMRIPEQTVEGIQDIARQWGKEFSSVAKELLEEGIRMHRCPGIVFSEGTGGRRRARIAGAGIEVWEVVALYQSIEKDFKRLQQALHWISEPQIRSALAYYRAYGEEIDQLITKNENWTKENIDRSFPFLAGNTQ